MLVFIDESGDAGFKVDKGSSTVFVVAMVVFQNREASDYADDQISALRRELGMRNEFKFNKCTPQIRDAFIRRCCDFDFTCPAIVVQKTALDLELLRGVKEPYHQFFIKEIIAHDRHLLNEARVFIDGEGARKSEREMKSYIRKHVPMPYVKDVGFRKSHSSGLIQLADMINGAIARAYRTERPSQQWLAPLTSAGKISLLLHY